MKKWVVRIAVGVLGILLIGFLIKSWTQSSETVYHGRTLREWARMLSGPTQVSAPALREIQQMGTNGVRLIVRLDRYRPHGTRYQQFKERVVRWINQKQKWRQFTLPEVRFASNLFILERE